MLFTGIKVIMDISLGGRISQKKHIWQYLPFSMANSPEEWIMNHLNELCSQRCYKIHWYGALICVSAKKMHAYWINKLFISIVMILDGRTGFVLPSFTLKPFFVAAVLNHITARCFKIHWNVALICVSAWKMLVHWIKSFFKTIVVIFDGGNGFVLWSFTS